MENPGTWDLLTSSLAVSSLAKTHETWAFLVVQGLVRDEGGDRETFSSIVDEVLAEGEITGPTMALRVTLRLRDAGVSTTRGERPDPGGKEAAVRRDVVRGWRGQG